MRNAIKTIWYLALATCFVMILAGHDLLISTGNQLPPSAPVECSDISGHADHANNDWHDDVVAIHEWKATDWNPRSLTSKLMAFSDPGMSHFPASIWQPPKLL